MQLQKYIPCFLILILLIASCIKRFDPEINSSDALKYVVSGGVYRFDTIQRISVSVASSLKRPILIAMPCCQVKIIDGNGNSYAAIDLLDGNYQIRIPESELDVGNRFMVDIVVPAGDHIISDYDSILDCPEVDSVYYQLKEIPTSNPFFPIRGIQFYVDLDAKNYPCRNYRIEATETWEYTAPFYVETAGKVCWVTSNIRNIITISTGDQTENIYKLSPINFVDNYSSQRLRYMYSLLVNQYSLSNAASDYWNKLRINTLGQGGLYENQPFQIIGNLRDISNPSQKVLGFFAASTHCFKRIFVGEISWLPNQYVDCRRAYWPEIQNPECLDCRRAVGGTNIKPDFWPN